MDGMDFARNAISRTVDTTVVNLDPQGSALFRFHGDDVTFGYRPELFDGGKPLDSRTKIWKDGQWKKIKSTIKSNLCIPDLCCSVILNMNCILKTWNACKTCILLWCYAPNISQTKAVFRAKFKLKDNQIYEENYQISFRWRLHCAKAPKNMGCI